MLGKLAATIALTIAIASSRLGQVAGPPAPAPHGPFASVDIRILEANLGGVLAGGELGQCGIEQTLEVADRQPSVNKQTYLVTFQQQQGFRIALTGIYIDLPLCLTEIPFLSPRETIKTIGTTKRVYATKAEAEEASKGKGGNITEQTSITPQSSTAQGVETKLVTHTTTEENFVTIEEQLTTVRTTLPGTALLTVRLIGPEGEVWSDTSEVTIRVMAITAGETVGMGRRRAYIELDQPITVDASRRYGVTLAITMPGPNSTSLVPAVGAELVGSTKIPTRGIGGVRFFYRIEPTDVGK